MTCYRPRSIKRVIVENRKRSSKKFLSVVNFCVKVITVMRQISGINYILYFKNGSRCTKFNRPKRET